MSDDFKLLAKLAADTTDFDSAMRRTANEARQWANEARQIFIATRTPMEQYEAAVERVHDAWRTGRIDTETFGRALRHLRREFDQTNTVMAEVVETGGRFQGLGRELAGSMLGFSTAVGAVVSAAMLATRAVEGLAHAAAGAATQAIRLAAEFETAEITFRTLFKSATVAKEVMAQIKQFSAQTPFEFPEIKNAAAQLAGFGINAKQIVPTLKMLGDIAAGTGTSVNELALTYGKARITGRAYTRDVMELANRNVPIWQALNKVLGTTNAETHKMVEDGKVGFAELQKAILSLVSDGGQFEGAMEDRAKGIEGLYSNLKDNITISLGDLGETMIHELDLKRFTQELIDLTGVFRTDGIPVVIEFTKGLVALADASNQALTVLTGIDLSTKGLTETIYGARASMLQWNLAVAKIIGSEEQVLDIQKEIIALGLRGVGLGPKTEAPGLPDIEKGGNQTGIDEEIAALQRQIEMIGKSAEEKQLAELVTKGLLEADMEYVAGLIEQGKAQADAYAAQQDARRAEEQTRRTMESHIAALKQQADTYGKTAREIDLYKASLAHATDEETKAINAQHDRLESLKFFDDMAKEMQRDREAEKKRIADDIEAVIAQNLTPFEKFEREMKRLDELKGQGLNDEQYNRAKSRAEREFINGGPKQPEYTSENRALLRGSAEAFSAINRANDKKKQEKILDDMLTIQKRQELIQKQQLAAQQNVQRWN